MIRFKTIIKLFLYTLIVGACTLGVTILCAKFNINTMEPIARVAILIFNWVVFLLALQLVRTSFYLINKYLFGNQGTYGLIIIYVIIIATIIKGEDIDSMTVEQLETFWSELCIKMVGLCIVSYFVYDYLSQKPFIKFVILNWEFYRCTQRLNVIINKWIVLGIFMSIILIGVYEILGKFFL